jgi:hypothetical protein
VLENAKISFFLINFNIMPGGEGYLTKNKKCKLITLCTLTAGWQAGTLHLNGVFLGDKTPGQFRTETQEKNSNFEWTEK